MDAWNGSIPPVAKPKKKKGISRIRAVDGIRTPGGLEVQDKLIIARKITKLANTELSTCTVKFRTNHLQP